MLSRFFTEKRLIYKESNEFEESPFWRNVPRDHSACGIGFVVTQKATRRAITMAMDGLCGMRERTGSAFGAGDGSGIIFATAGAKDFFARQQLTRGRSIETCGDLSVGMFFFAHGVDNSRRKRHEINRMMVEEGIVVHGWRDLPVNDDVLPAHVRNVQPKRWQLLYSPPAEGMSKSEYRRRLFVVQQRIERTMKGVYPVSLNPDTVVYKDRATPDQFRQLYPDLDHPDCASSHAAFHGRKGTNTDVIPENTQPFRVLLHNGEVNSDRTVSSAQNDLEIRLGVTMEGEDCVTVANWKSDSAHTDGMILVRMVTDKVTSPQVARRLILPSKSDLWKYDEKARRHFETIRRTQGPLSGVQGPMAIIGLTGHRAWAAMDPLNLRTLWFYGNDDVTVGSSLPGHPSVPLEELKFVHRLSGGDIAMVNLKERNGRGNGDGSGVVYDVDLVLPKRAEEMISQDPLTMTGDDRLFALDNTPDVLDGVEIFSKDEVIKMWNQVGGDQHVVKVLQSMVKDAKEPILGMGDDRPLAVMSPGRLRAAALFSQLGAIVTNPPIDPIREGADFDLTTYLGRSPKQLKVDDPNTYVASPEFKLPSPIMNPAQLKAMKENSEISYREIDCTFEGENGDDMERRLREIIQQCVLLADAGTYPILIFTDRACLGEGRKFVPQVLVISAVDQTLKNKGLRSKVSLVADTMDALEAHDSALLVSQGADGVCPYLLWETVMNDEAVKWEQTDRRVRMDNVQKSLNASLMKIMAKMGIATVDGYRGGCFFEVLGVDNDVSKKYLPNNISRIGGLNFDHFVEDQRERLKEKRSALRTIREATSRHGRIFGFLNQLHLLKPENKTSKEIYKALCEYVEGRDPIFLRNLLDFVSASERGGQELGLDQVESVASIICRHFRGAQMSDGALGPVAHAALAASINAMAAKYMPMLEAEGESAPGFSRRLKKRPKSGGGEGGEHHTRYPGGPLEEGCSRSKQIASGRFGVDAWYIISVGDDGELNVKLGQGAKPYQGGQVDGAKIDKRQAKQRGTLPGMTLISPPPQHDIYSIEDLMRLIWDLRAVYPEIETVSVKVTTKAGIGTIVTGIAQSADKACLSGNVGGTGAAESSATRYTGNPNELGLFETYCKLKKSGMFDKILLEVDGGIVTGNDIVMLAVLSSDEFGFGTSLLEAAMGCIFCHDCHCNICPVGITTTSAENMIRLALGAKAESLLEKGEKMTAREQYELIKVAVENYWVLLAEHVREILAKLGVPSLEACRGRFDLLKRISKSPESDRVNLDFLWQKQDLDSPDFGDMPIFERERVNAVNRAMVDAARDCEGDKLVMKIPLKGSKDYQGEASDSGMGAIGATLAGKIAKGEIKVPSGGFHFEFEGYPGQSFGFMNVEGVTLKLVGIVNDFVGSGMSGGKIVIVPPEHLRGEEPIDLAGATCAYGARKHADSQVTGGKLFIAGRVGQRFGVRCCLDAVIVCEGCDRYGFEYMTGGIGVVLGEVSSGFGSGMSAGELFVFDESNTLNDRLHKESVKRVELNEDDKDRLYALLVEYYADTESPKAKRILGNWEVESQKFAKVVSTYQPKVPEATELGKERLADMGDFPIIDEIRDGYVNAA